jgi:hypothetical protein
LTLSTARYHTAGEVLDMAGCRQYLCVAIVLPLRRQCLTGTSVRCVDTDVDELQRSSVPRSLPRRCQQHLDRHASEDRYDMLIIWVVIAIVVLVSAFLIYAEHDWGFILGGSTALILVISYVSTEWLLRSPLVVLLPQGARSQFDAMAITAVVLIVLALVVIAYLLGRRRGSDKKP